MLIPTKHTNFSQSLLGFGSYVIKKIIISSKTVDELWNDYQNDYKQNKYASKHSFDNLILALIFLYSIGIIKENNGGIEICN